MPAAASLLLLTACGSGLLGASATTAATSRVVTIAATVTRSTDVTAPAAAGTSIVASTAAASPAPTTRVLASSATTSSGQTTVAVYFTQGGRLVAESRSVPAAAPARGSLVALLAGPTIAGHFSQVPSGARLLGINLANGTATVDLSDQATNVEGSPAIPLFLGQIVDTLTQFPDVQHVVLEVNGQTLHALGGEGVAVPEPLDKAAIQKMLAGNG